MRSEREWTQEEIDDSMAIEDEEDEFDDFVCGRWRNGRLAPQGECLLAGTEDCDWECPYRSLPWEAK